MAFKSWNSFGIFAKEVRYRSRYSWSKEVNEFLTEVERTSKERVKEIPKNWDCYRAQLGNDWREEGYGAYVPCAHPESRMFPLSHQASEGRANAKGIPHLYVASNANTAMAEVRPFVGSPVSLARLHTTKNLKVINCSLRHSFKGCIYNQEPDDETKENSVWSYIDREFSRPVISTENTADYAPTQIISEMFRSKGYDGIVYKSMLGDGYNVVSFDLESTCLLSCHLYEAKSVEFDFQESANPYFMRQDKGID